MVEKDFQRDLTRGLRAQGCFAWAWPDLARAVTKPFDICMSSDYIFQPIECKLTKYTRRKPLGPDDIALSPANFKGRGHQLPRLLRMLDQNQASPRLAVCVVRVENHQVVEKMACMAPVSQFREKIIWTIGELLPYYALTWTPRIGWTQPWRNDPDETLLKDEE